MIGFTSTGIMLPVTAMAARSIISRASVAHDDHQDERRSCWGHGLAVLAESTLYKFILRSNKPEARESVPQVAKVHFAIDV